jgi:TolB-like protein
MIAMRDASKFPFMSGLFRRVAALKSLSSRGRLHHCGGIHHSDRICSFSRMGITELDIPLAGDAPTDRISHRLDSRMGVRRHAARNSGDKGNRRRNASSSQHDHSCCNRRDRFDSRGVFLLPRASAGKIDKSIAVLPFENLSDEKENAYFADGIQDDILTNLAKIGDLKVISRTSVMPYRGSGMRNARDIGKALGVATLLEGSVRRIGNRVRVNVQLINANNDEHFGRKITTAI